MPAGRPLEWTPEKYEALAKELIEWANEEESCHLAQFTGIRYGKTRQWLYSLCELSDTLKSAWESSKEIIASRYCKKALINEWNASTAKSWAGVYDKELKAHEIEMAQAKGITKDEVGEIVVNVVKFQKDQNEK